MDDTQVTDRQEKILELLNGRLLSREQVATELPVEMRCSKVTVIRDLQMLGARKLIIREGRGRSTRYRSAQRHELLKFINLQRYFALEPDQRQQIKRQFDWGIFDQLHNLLTSEETAVLDRLNSLYRKKLTDLDLTLKRKELERFVIELSWKSSKIEGNTYSLLETERLIKEAEEAVGHSKTEAVMILNHKVAFEAILNNVKSYQKLTLQLIENLHQILVRGLSITAGFRSHGVGITGTLYRPPDNQWQVREAMEKTVEVANAIDNPIEMAVVVSAMVAYIQPFADGNKRTSRMLANAVLLAHDYCPLSYRNVDEIVYKQALILWFEQQNLYHFKRMFLEQFNFAVETYF